ncbi:MAG: amidohydrolase [Syntrophorhabdaceae bacterium]|nr:amidohydrolase [Syntrophorhabdaceae bacterium]
MKVIDVHNHLYPVKWLDFLKDREGTLKLIKKDRTNMAFYYRGTRLATINTAGHFDPIERIKDMDAYGIDIQIMSLTTPGVELISPSEGVYWAKEINDYFALLCETYKGRLFFNAVIPCKDVKETVKEMERAKKDLSAKGITMFSNIDGEPIYSEAYLPIFEAAEGYDLPIFIHPAPPVTTEVMSRMRMPLPLFGFIIDTTMAVTGLIFNGITERFPGLKIVHAHLGGVFPYLVGRIDDCYNTYKDDFGFSLKEKPSEYYRRNVYDDIISFHTPALRCAIEFMGTDRLMVGTDYAHPIGGPERALNSIKSLGLDPDDIDKIMGGNAARLYNIPLE